MTESDKKAVETRLLMLYKNVCQETFNNNKVITYKSTCVLACLVEKREL